MRNRPMILMGLVEYRFSVRLDVLTHPIVRSIGGVRSQAAVALLCVVPRKVSLEMGAYFFRIREASGV